MPFRQSAWKPPRRCRRRWQNRSGTSSSPITTSRSSMRLPAEITAGTRRALAGETVANVEQPEGDRILEAYSTPLLDAGRIIGAVTIVRDVTEKKLAEERLRQAHKLESIALLAGGIAHDFNNILTVVSGNIALAPEQGCQHCRMRAGL